MAKKSTPTLDMINKNLGTKYQNINHFLFDAELPFGAAGRERWAIIRDGGTVEDNRGLWNTSYESCVHDKRTRQLLINRIRGHAKDKVDWAYWESLVPEWAYEVRDSLADRGIPFSFELLADPDINVDGTKPLFKKGVSPVSLIQITGNQKGELNYLRSLKDGAITLMEEVWPPYWEYYHRGPGEEVPNHIPAGLMFGAYPAEAPDGTKVMRSPLTLTESYAAAQASGELDEE